MNTVQNALCSKSLNHETVNAVNTPWHGDSLTSDSILFYNMQVNVFWCTNSDMFYKLWTVSWHPNSYITLIVAIINNYVGSQLQNEYFWEQKISSTKKRKDCVCAFVCVCVCGERQREREHTGQILISTCTTTKESSSQQVFKQAFFIIIHQVDEILTIHQCYKQQWSFVKYSPTPLFERRCTFGCMGKPLILYINNMLQIWSSNKTVIPVSTDNEWCEHQYCNTCCILYTL